MYTAVDWGMLRRSRRIWWGGSDVRHEIVLSGSEHTPEEYLHIIHQLEDAASNYPNLESRGALVDPIVGKHRAEVTVKVTCGQVNQQLSLSPFARKLPSQRRRCSFWRSPLNLLDLAHVLPWHIPPQERH